MNYPVLFERIVSADFPAGYYYVYLPTLGLTTHGLGIDGAKAAVTDLALLWIAEKQSNATPSGKRQTVQLRPAKCLVAPKSISTCPAGSISVISEYEHRR
jgi:hypothetical protein